MLPADLVVTDAVNKCYLAAENDERTTGVHKRDEINTILEGLPQCPPTRAQMNLSTIFMHFPGRDVDGVSECFRSNNGIDPEVPTQPVTFFTVCCYGNNG